MVKLTTAEAMQKAIDKARAVKPRVRVVNFGSYIVTNKQTGAAYTVTCEKRDGERLARARKSVRFALSAIGDGQPDTEAVCEAERALAGALREMEQLQITLAVMGVGE